MNRTRPQSDREQTVKAHQNHLRLTSTNLNSPLFMLTRLHLFFSCKFLTLLYTFQELFWNSFSNILGTFRDHLGNFWRTCSPPFRYFFGTYTNTNEAITFSWVHCIICSELKDLLKPCKGKSQPPKKSCWNFIKARTQVVQKLFQGTVGSFPIVPPKGFFSVGDCREGLRPPRMPSGRVPAPPRIPPGLFET